MTSAGHIAEILSHWSVALERPRPDIGIAGSPERTIYRIVLEDRAGQLWLLEKIPGRLKHRKREIILFLEHLKQQGFQYAPAYHPHDTGGYHVEDGDALWQLIPFISGMDLDRPGYVFDGWRGACIANCLVSFREAARQFPAPAGRGFFSITDYVTDMTGRIERHNPELLTAVAPLVAYLKKTFFKPHNSLPVALCHGDYHPLNLIWKPDGIAALIDWEFFGLKPEAYDVANMVGCLGMEDPESLHGDMVLSFLEALKGASFLSGESWRTLPDLILAIRFAWFAEWLRKSDTEMVALELTYMYLLMENRDQLNTLWEIR
jgi:homoserine kinase type II